MGVIGRLDDQVDEIIIKPVGARRKQESTETPTAQQERTPEDAAAEEERAQDEENPKARTAALPVWLL